MSQITKTSFIEDFLKNDRFKMHLRLISNEQFYLDPYNRYEAVNLTHLIIVGRQSQDGSNHSKDLWVSPFDLEELQLFPITFRNCKNPLEFIEGKLYLSTMPRGDMIKSLSKDNFLVQPPDDFGMVDVNLLVSVNELKNLLAKN
jgi:hypothetical protein